MAGLFIRGLSLYYSAGQIAGEFTNHGNTNMKTHAHVGTVLLTSLGIVGMAMAADQGPIATLVRVDGTVIASQDARYIPAREGLSLKEGDRLMVLADGKAIVRFLDGCEYSLADQAVLVVQHVSTCASNGGGVYRVDPHSGVAGGTTPQPQLAAIGDTPMGPVLPSMVDIAVGSAALIAVAILANQDDGGNTSSGDIGDPPDISR